MKKIYKEFFCIPKNKKISDKVFTVQIIVSVFTMLICGILYCSTTFAWFTCQKNVGTAEIQSATYRLKVEIGEEDTFSYICPLEQSDEHQVKLTAMGTAKKGYCVIFANGTLYRTETICPGESISITVQAAKGTGLQFFACWGEPGMENGASLISTFTASDSNAVSEILYGDGDSIYVSETPYVMYTVEDGVTLEMLAEYYGVPEEDILIYNGIEELTVGEEIRIPNTTVEEPFMLEKPVVVATPANATPAVDVPSVATPSDATSSNAKRPEE